MFNKKLKAKVEELRKEVEFIKNDIFKFYKVKRAIEENIGIEEIDPGDFRPFEYKLIKLDALLDYLGIEWKKTETKGFVKKKLYADKTTSTKRNENNQDQ